MELTIENLIKIIVGVLVVAAIVYGLYLFFTNQFLDFFKNTASDNLTKFFLVLF
jgi:hypothetical protein